MTLYKLHEMNNDWDSETIFEIHAYEDWDNEKILYRGSWADMPMKYGKRKVRAFGTIDMDIYIELEPGEENL